MSTIPKYCLVCLDNNIVRLQSVSTVDRQGITLKEKLDFCVFELTKSQLNFVGYLCRQCAHAIDLFYKIKSLCLSNDQKVKNIIDSIRERFTSVGNRSESDSIISETVESRNLKKRTVLSCARCPRIFRSERCLQKHMKIHKNMTLFECTQCLKRFSCKFHLKEHLQFHKQSPELIDAIKKFKKVRSRMYQCNICSVTIFRKINLKRHFKRLHLESNVYFSASFSVVGTPQNFRSLAKDNKYDADVSSDSESDCRFDLDETLSADELQEIDLDDNGDIVVDGDIDMYNSYFTNNQALLEQNCQVVPI